jgi:integrase
LITKRYYTTQEIARIEDKIINYIDHLKKQKLNLSTIKGRVYSIFKFYTANRVNLDRKHISQYFPAPSKTKEDLPYTIEDVQKMLKATTNPERDNFMLYLLSSTGMRVGALSDLTYGDIEPMYPEGYQGKHLYKVIVYRGTREEYYTFTTFECAEALDSYTDYRIRMGETITKDSPLLRDQFSSNYRTKKKNQANFLSSFSDVVDRITNRAGVRTKGNDRQKRHSKMLDHAFRKMVNSKMIEAGVEYDTKEFLLAHKTTRGLDTSYSRIPVNKRLNEYVKAIDLLTISPENRLRKQAAEQEHTIQYKLAEKDKQIEEMIRKQEQFEQLIQSLIDSRQLKPTRHNL